MSALDWIASCLVSAFDWIGSNLDWLIELALLILAIVATVVFWSRFIRMMDDVHRIAEVLAPKKKAKPPPELEREQLYREFRDDGTTKR